MIKNFYFVFILLASIFGILSASSAIAENSGLTANNEEVYSEVFPKHEPYGKGIGVKPGRVVWSHNPDSVDWNGEGYWWNTDNFNETVILKMVNNSIATLADSGNTKYGWNKLFEDFNKRNNDTGGYMKGEKVAIKANMNGSGTFGDETDTYMSYTNPVLLKALLLSLVTEGDVNPNDITVYDVSRVFPDYMIEMCSQSVLEGVNFEYRDVLGTNDCKADTNVPVVWSKNFSSEKNYLPTCVTEAKYMINLANLKGHSYGITLCGKNHFGTLMNSSRLRPPEAADLHQFLAGGKMSEYTALVDLMGNYQLGGKTMLYILDGIICPPSEGASVRESNSKWQQAPFNNDYTSSIFVSQDPVAIDSVGADFLINEPTITNNNSSLRNNANVDEAGLVSDSPSGTVYINGNGKKIINLGVHEHWNNPVDKQYSRNLGKNEGIELVMAEDNSENIPPKDDNPQKTIKYGDVDTDGIITASDAAMLLAYVRNKDYSLPIKELTENFLSYIDVDINNIITATDAAIVLQKALNGSFVMPVEKSTISEETSENTTETVVEISTENVSKADRDTLIVYFSRTDKTKSIADKIQNITGYDIARITPVIPYPEEYSEILNQAKEEQNNDYRPEINIDLESIDKYDTIILGYPIWWGETPPVINTFLDSYNLSGKTIIPFCTSGSTGMSGSISKIKEICYGSEVKSGRRFESNETQEHIKEWLNENNII